MPKVLRTAKIHSSGILTRSTKATRDFEGTIRWLYRFCDLADFMHLVSCAWRFEKKIPSRIWSAFGKSSSIQPTPEPAVAMRISSGFLRSPCPNSARTGSTCSPRRSCESRQRWTGCMIRTRPRRSRSRTRFHQTTSHIRICRSRMLTFVPDDLTDDLKEIITCREVLRHQRVHTLSGEEEEEIVDARRAFHTELTEKVFHIDTGSIKKNSGASRFLL